MQVQLRLGQQARGEDADPLIATHTGAAPHYRATRVKPPSKTEARATRQAKKAACKRQRR